MTADCSAAGIAESFVTQDVDCSVAGDTEGSVAGGVEYFGGTFLVSFCLLPSQSSSCSSLFLQMEQCSLQEHFSVACLGITMA